MELSESTLSPPPPGLSLLLEVAPLLLVVLRDKEFVRLGLHRTNLVCIRHSSKPVRPITNSLFRQLH